MLTLALEAEKRLDGVTARWVPCVEPLVKEHPVVRIHHTRHKKKLAQSLSLDLSLVCLPFE